MNDELHEHEELDSVIVIEFLLLITLGTGLEFHLVLIQLRETNLYRRNDVPGESNEMNARDHARFDDGIERQLSEEVGTL
jgi:hypothetical protein